MTPTAPIPDALIFPEKWKQGNTLYDRLDSVLTIAEAILGVGRGEAWLKRQPGGWSLIVKSPDDLLYWPLNHPLRGHERYRWVERDDGSRWGYLTEEARLDQRTEPKKA